MYIKKINKKISEHTTKHVAHRICLIYRVPDTHPFNPNKSQSTFTRVDLFNRLGKLSMNTYALAISSNDIVFSVPCTVVNLIVIIFIPHTHKA